MEATSSKVPVHKFHLVHRAPLLGAVSVALVSNSEDCAKKDELMGFGRRAAIGCRDRLVRDGTEVGNLGETQKVWALKLLLSYLLANLSLLTFEVRINRQNLSVLGSLDQSYLVDSLKIFKERSSHHCVEVFHTSLKSVWKHILLAQIIIEKQPAVTGKVHHGRPH